MGEQRRSGNAVEAPAAISAWWRKCCFLFFLFFFLETMYMP
jgi:hypothetical protein